MSAAKMAKAFPVFKTDAEAEHFVDHADLTEYDMSGFTPMKLELLAKEARIMLRLPQPLLNAVKAAAARKKIPYSRYIRMTLEHSLEG